MPLPYENATSGDRAYTEIQKILTKFGCEEFGMMTNNAEGYTMVQFSHRQRTIQLRASCKGYAAAWLREHPYKPRMRVTRAEHDERALERGKMAAPSILRDWIKAQVTAIEIGLMPFEEAFMPQMLLPDGRRVIEVARKQLKLEGPKE